MNPIRIPSRLFASFFLLAATLLPLRFASGQQLPNTTRLLRFPTTNGEQIVFCYSGELYTVPKTGGVARRLTSGPGYTSFPHFSPDGKQLAFTSQYDGNTEVYVMDGDGSEPKRLTTTATLGRDDISDRMGPNNLVMGWENTQPLVVFRSRRNSFNSFIGDLETVGMNAELPKQLPVPRGGFVSFAPDDSKMAFNRVFREFRTWKHYRGGMADDVWIFDFKTQATENLTNDPAQDICPMWGPDNHVYFLSDRDGRMNLFSIDLGTKETKQLTRFKDFDIKFPTIGKDSIVFEQAGYIWRYDLTSGQSTPVPIEIKEDFASGRAAAAACAQRARFVDLARGVVPREQLGAAVLRVLHPVRHHVPDVERGDSRRAADGRGAVLQQMDDAGRLHPAVPDGRRAAARVAQVDPRERWNQFIWPTVAAL